MRDMRILPALPEKVGIFFVSPVGGARLSSLEKEDRNEQGRRRENNPGAGLFRLQFRSGFPQAISRRAAARCARCGVLLSLRTRDSAVVDRRRARRFAPLLRSAG
ncbi:hypothetical protein MPL1032_130146 [Mesorhizobium plurifarium]|uniref:Uncharacterized protein n=1 Tax=Mesorhizobium plurifarium TaxID=69974 RepID=A0A0K2VQF1_MESPL|nr:hypothetical protein MPL1032_130146 [Mesorhizobium plurifarium]